MDNQLIAVGQIVAPHGVRGDVRVILLTDFPERFNDLKKVIIDNGLCLEIQYAKFHKQFVLLKFRGVDNRDDVEKLRGKLIYLNRKDLLPLPEGHYYHFEIIGLNVYKVDGKYLGNITDIISTGSNDVYITEQQGEQPLLIPALKQVVLSIDIENQTMIVKLQEEWDDHAD